MADRNELEQALLAFNSGQTAAIRQAEGYLKEYMKDFRSVEGFLVQLQQSQHLNVRQLAGVLLRKNVNKHWAKIPSQNQEPFKQLLLNILVNETERLPRRAIASVISKVAKHQMQNWPELLQTISLCCSHTEEAYREVGMLMLYQQYDTVGQTLSKEFPALVQLFSNALKDPSVRVRVMALKACGALIESLALEKSVLKFQALIPLMISVIGECVGCGEDDAAVQALEVFGEMAESPSPILKPHLEHIIRAVLTIGASTDVELPVRDAALTILSQLANNKPKTISKMQLVPVIVETLLKINTEPVGSDEEDAENDEDEDGMNISASLTPHKMANICFDNVAKALPNKYVYAPSIQASLNAINSNTVEGVRAGINVLGIISEGCADKLEQDLDTLIPIIAQAGVQSMDLEVRRAVCYTLGQWATYMKDDVGNFHGIIMPLLFQLLQDTRLKVIDSSLYLAECFTEAMAAENIKHYTDALIGNLINIVSQGELKTKSKALAAITSIVVANEEAIAPYFDSCVPVLEACMSNTTEEYNILRGEALQCLGCFAEHIDPRKFEPICRPVMNIAIECLKLEDPEMDEYIFAFFGSVAACLKENFEEYSGHVVEVLLQKVESKDGMDLFSKNDADQYGGADIDFGEEDDEDGGPIQIRVRTSMMDMKAAALDCLGKTMMHSYNCVRPQLPNVVQVLLNLSVYFHEEIRAKAMQALHTCVLAEFESVVGCDYVPNDAPLPSSTVNLLENLMPVFMDRMAVDESKEVAAMCVESLVNFVSAMGKSCFFVDGKDFIDPLMKQLLLFVNNKGKCQILYEEEEYDDDDDDHDDQLMDSVTDCIGALTCAIGPSFQPHVHPFIKPLSRYLNTSRTASDRSMAVGCYAEILDGLKHAAAPYMEDMLPVAFAMLRDEHEKVQRNACFLIGVMATNAPDNSSFFNNLNDILLLMQPFFVNAEQFDGALVDNACSAIARLIVRSSTVLPMHTLLPVFLRTLPLREDHQEDEAVYNAIFFLVQQGHPCLAQNKTEVMRVFQEACAPGSEVADRIKETISHVAQSLK
jgi:hypothetical protein